MKDVAKRAGVSTTTVSHVINQTRYVSEELSKRVHEAMEVLDYQPNLLASSLRSGESKIIGLIIPDISNQFFSEISRKIEDHGLEHGYSVIVCNTDDDIEKETKYIDILIAKQVDGIIFISAGDEATSLRKPISSSMPIVVADRDIENQKVNTVIVDNFHGGYEATSYLIQLGHKRIGFISGPSMITPSSERFEGYKQALEESDIPIDPSLIVTGDFRYQGGEQAMNTLLSIEPRPTAIFACNDMMALGAIRTSFIHGVRVPDEMSIIGFDNIPLSQTSFPALTTMAQPTEEMASQIMALLMELINYLGDRRKPNIEEFKYQKVILKTKLIKRDSCKRL